MCRSSGGRFTHVRLRVPGHRATLDPDAIDGPMLRDARFVSEMAPGRQPRGTGGYGQDRERASFRCFVWPARRGI